MDTFSQAQSDQTSHHLFNDLHRMNLRSPNEILDNSQVLNTGANQENMMPIYPVPNCPIPVMRLLYDERKFLSSARVVQGNIVCVFNLPPHLEEGPHLKDFSHFGRFGPVIKVTLRRKITKTKSLAIPTLSQKGAVSAFIVYRRCEDALTAIITLSKMKIGGRQLKATLGSAVYCKNVLRGISCNEQNCVKLHYKCAPEATFNAEQMANGLHIAYQRKKLIEIYQLYFSNWSQQTQPGTEGHSVCITPAELEEYLADLASMEFCQDHYAFSNNSEMPCHNNLMDDRSCLAKHSPMMSTFYPSSRNNFAPYECGDSLESRRLSALSSTTFIRQMMLSPKEEAGIDNLKIDTNKTHPNNLTNMMPQQSSLSEGSSPLSEMAPKAGGPLQLSPRQQQMLMILRRSAANQNLNSEPVLAQQVSEFDLLRPNPDWEPQSTLSSRSNSWPLETNAPTNAPIFNRMSQKSSSLKWFNQQSDSGFGSTTSCPEKRQEESGVRAGFASLLPSTLEIFERNNASKSSQNSSQDSSLGESSSDCELEGDNNKMRAPKLNDSCSEESGLDSVTPPDSGLISTSALDFDPVEAAKHGLAREMLCESAIRLAELAVKSLSFLSPATLPPASRDTLKSLAGNIRNLVQPKPQPEPDNHLDATNGKENYHSLLNLHQNLVNNREQYISQLHQVLGLFNDSESSVSAPIET